jgi:hypothetical protein
MRVSYLTLRPVAMHLTSILLFSALEAQSRALSSFTGSTFHEDPPSPPSNRGLLLHPRCMPSWHERTVIPKDKAAQNSLIIGDLGPVLVEISSFRAIISCWGSLPESPCSSTQSHRLASSSQRIGGSKGSPKFSQTPSDLPAKIFPRSCLRFEF